MTDDELERFAAQGAEALPDGDDGVVTHDGADIWYSAYGSGPAVILLHGGLGNSGNWGYQVPALLRSGRRVVVIDSRGHGRSTRDGKPYTYELMASDVLAVMIIWRSRRLRLLAGAMGRARRSFSPTSTPSGSTACSSSPAAWTRQA